MTNGILTWFIVTEALPDLPQLLTESETAVRRGKPAFQVKCDVHARIRQRQCGSGVTAIAIGVVDSCLDDLDGRRAA